MLEPLRDAYAEALAAYFDAVRNVEIAMCSLRSSLNREQLQLCAERFTEEDKAKVDYEAARDAFLLALRRLTANV